MFMPKPNPSTALQEISDMLTYCRPAGSKTEKRFISKFIVPLGVERRDLCGNLSKRIGRAPIIWSCHTDTVHFRKGFQIVAADDDVIGLSKNSGSSCLGADDTAGVWLMMEMIRANVEGLYLFHREEEKGGIGSRYMAKTAANELKEYHFAVALDRKGTTDVITHQFDGRCCSDAFAKSLAAQLGEKFKPSDSGTFTDTANYTDLIGECTNISVGYYSQHTNKETLDFGFLQNMRDRLCQLDVSQLERKRTPGEVDPNDFNYNSWIYEGRSYASTVTTTNTKHWNGTRSIVAAKGNYNWLDDYYPNGDERLGMVELIQRHPAVAADLLEQCGYTEDDVRECVKDLGLV